MMYGDPVKIMVLSRNVEILIRLTQEQFILGESLKSDIQRVLGTTVESAPDEKLLKFAADAVTLIRNLADAVEEDDPKWAETFRKIDGRKIFEEITLSDIGDYSSVLGH